MSVIPLTVFLSLLLAGTFVVLFSREQRRRQFTSPERDSLLPLADEQAHVVERDLRARFERVQKPRSIRKRGPAENEPDHAPCGCRRGARPPCADCLKRRDELEPAYF